MTARAKTSVLLFDVDGVLIDARAYRLCVKRTLEILLPQLGLLDASKWLPSEADVSYFEACGIHDVWDIANIIYAQILAAASVVKDVKDVSAVDYRTFVDRMMSSDQNFASHPTSTAMSLLREDFVHAEPSLHVLGIEATLVERTVQELAEFLTGSRSVYKSHVTRLFQNILLGSAQFSITYGLASSYDGQSLLQAEDRVLIGDETVSRLKELCLRDDFKVGIYTARPSKSPGFATVSAIGYSPEAEIALESTEMSEFPLVAMGTMEYLAERESVLAETLVKPNLTQAFAALIGALNKGLSDDLLEQAYQLGQRNNVAPDNTSLDAWKDRSLEVFVFEDTVSGIKPMCEVAAYLNQHGYEIVLTGLGIARDENKRSALSKLCSRVFADVNEAVDYALAAVEQSKSGASEGVCS